MDFQYQLGQNTEKFGANSASLRSVRIENALLELSDQESIPDLRCHFSGFLEYGYTWIKFNLGGEYYVKSIKLFNMKNGHAKSNLEGAWIYVGEILCAIAPFELPENEIIEIECVDPNAE